MNTQPQYITDASGHKISVILPIEEYIELMEDLAAVAELKDEESVPFEEALAEIAYGLTRSHQTKCSETISKTF